MLELLEAVALALEAEVFPEVQDPVALDLVVRELRAAEAVCLQSRVLVLGEHFGRLAVAAGRVEVAVRELVPEGALEAQAAVLARGRAPAAEAVERALVPEARVLAEVAQLGVRDQAERGWEAAVPSRPRRDRKSTRLNSSH